MIVYGKKLTQIPPELCSVADYEKRAKELIAPDIWEYIDSGAGDDISRNKNLLSYNDIQIWNRVLRDVSQGHTRCKLNGLELPHPIILGPVAHQKLVDPAGEIATAQAASATDTLMVTSTLASHTLEEIAENSSQYRWFQLYWQNDREQSLALLRRAEKLAYKAIVITVDVPINGLRRRIQRADFSLPQDAAAINIQNANMPLAIAEGQSEIFQGWMSTAPTWEDIAWLISETTLPVYIKGILHPDDAEQAAKAGATGIIISNHGGRALDGVPSPLTVLPLIRKAIGNDIPLLIDGGIRQGSDVFKAIAFGANAVCLGRPQFYGLAVAGALGVAHIIKLLRQELEVTMALAGCATLTDINSSCIFQGNN